MASTSAAGAMSSNANAAHNLNGNVLVLPTQHTTNLHFPSDMGDDGSQLPRDAGQLLGEANLAGQKPPVALSPAANTLLNHKQQGPNVKQYRMPYVNLFKNNRLAKEDHKLQFVDNGKDKLKFDFEHLDTVEHTFGICLLGYLISGKPPQAALLDLVKRWGKDIRFNMHDNGWIVFTFPTLEAKTRVLNGGSYMVYGYHLFLKEMPACFRFREEDMNSIPLWVQLHGLPPVCWNSHILSNITSRIGKPIHMDMLTHTKKRVKYARVLIEVDTSLLKMESITIELPIGDIDVKIIYEGDVIFCNHCHKAGHAQDHCFQLNKTSAATARQQHTRNRSMSIAGNRRGARGRSGFRAAAPQQQASVTAAVDCAVVANTPPAQIVQPPVSNIPPSSAQKQRATSVPCIRAVAEQNINSVAAVDNFDEFAGCGSDSHSDDDIPKTAAIDKGKNKLSHDDLLRTNDGFKVVVDKKNRKNKHTANQCKKEKNKGAKNQVDDNLRTFFKGLQSPEPDHTEHTPLVVNDGRSRLSGDDHKGRQPTIASVPR